MLVEGKGQVTFVPKESSVRGIKKLEMQTEYFDQMLVGLKE